MDQSNIPTSKRTPSTWQTSSAMQESVNKYISLDPDKYKAAQAFGEFLLSTQFASCDTFKVSKDDIVGEELRYQTLCRNIAHYGFKQDDLSTDEITLLKKKLGDNWISVFVD